MQQAIYQLNHESSSGIGNYTPPEHSVEENSNPFIESVEGRRHPQLSKIPSVNNNDYFFGRESIVPTQIHGAEPNGSPDAWHDKIRFSRIAIESMGALTNQELKQDQGLQTPVRAARHAQFSETEVPQVSRKDKHARILANPQHFVTNDGSQ